MSVLLDLAYLSVAAVGSPFLLCKALTSEKYRTGYAERSGHVAAREGDAACLWVHGVSVGEMNLVRPLVEALARELPGWDLVFSTATNTGRATAQRLYPGHRVIYYPLDFSWMVRRSLSRVRPDAILLVELEIWPNFLAEAARAGVPVAIVNGRISERAFRRYRLIRPLVAKWLQRIAVFCVQNETYADRLAALGTPADRLLITGNLKFDACPPAAPTGRDEALAASFGIRTEERVIVGGCTWPGEDEALVQAYQNLRKEFPDIRLLLAPRQADRFRPVEDLLRQAGLPCIRRTALQKGESGSRDAVILLDTVGELPRVYGLGTLVFVGGSLTRHGGHNTLEPGGLAKPVLFGPYTDNFRDITDEFLARHAARLVADAAELESALHELLRDPEAAQALGRRAREVVDRHRGATQRTLEAIKPFFSRRQEKGSRRA